MAHVNLLLCPWSKPIFSIIGRLLFNLRVCSDSGLARQDRVQAKPHYAKPTAQCGSERELREGLKRKRAQESQERAQGSGREESSRVSSREGEPHPLSLKQLYTVSTEE